MKSENKKEQIVLENIENMNQTYRFTFATICLCGEIETSKEES
jgi:hypothetical protein